VKKNNRLIHEKSPYLLQHAHNPVDWFPWGAEAFEKAKKEDKPIFLSIGYSTCHWCHVMEHESFENGEIAKVMNENFVSIKVDREERPDIDQIYMAAVQAMTGGGGWPLSAFLTHDLAPFFTGTYFPPEGRYGHPGFKDVLVKIAQIWKEDREKLTASGQQIKEALQQTTRAGAGPELSIEMLRRAVLAFRDIFDPVEGGFGGAPKFPRSETVSLLFRIHRRTGEEKVLRMATQSLDKMARGGIYDHLGGGFHRYATDARWLVPHFEKMLYDNALLVKSYLEAYQIDRNEMWASVAHEILDYVLREMTSVEGGFFSAQDADSEGVEGKFYVWTEEELKKILMADEFKKIKEVLQTAPHGNWEGNNILHMDAQTAWSVREDELFRSARQKLLDHRSKRIPPYKDDKILASWNGLMIGAMAFGAQVLGDEKYLAAARKAASFLLKKMWDGKTLKRRYREGEVKFNGSLDDYTFLAQGLLDLYEADFDPQWFAAAEALQKRADELFWDTASDGYFFTDSSDPSLIARTKEIYDGAVPSGNSIAAMNLLRLHEFTLDPFYSKRADQTMRAFSQFINTHPQAGPAFLMAIDFATDQAKEIVVAGVKSDPAVQAILRDLHRLFLPNKVLGLADEDQTIPLLKGKIPIDGRATIYLCQGHTCQKPVHSLDEIKPALLDSTQFKLY